MGAIAFAGTLGTSSMYDFLIYGTAAAWCSTSCSFPPFTR